MPKWFKKLGEEKINFYNFIASVSSIIVIAGTLGTYIWYDATNKTETRKDLVLIFHKLNATDSLLLINSKEHTTIIATLRKDSSDIKKLDIKKQDKKYIDPKNLPLSYLGSINPNEPESYLTYFYAKDNKLYYSLPPWEHN